MTFTKAAAMAAMSAALVAVPAAASAAITTFDDRTAFTAAIGGPSTTESFSNCGGSTVTLGGGVSLSSSSLGPCSAIADGVTFTPNGELYIAGPGQSANPTTALGVNTPSGGTVTVLFDSAVDAFGVDLFQNFGGGSQGGGPATFRFTLHTVGGGVSNFDTLGTPGAGEFFGFTFTSPLLEKIVISQDGGFAVIDDVTFSSGGAVVPEPATWAMMILGFGAAGSMIRRRRTAIA